VQYLVTIKSKLFHFPLLDFDEIIKARLTMDVKPNGGQTNLA
jgi:hypothetical protein